MFATTVLALDDNIQSFFRSAPTKSCYAQGLETGKSPTLVATYHCWHDIISDWQDLKQLPHKQNAYADLEGVLRVYVNLS